MYLWPFELGLVYCIALFTEYYSVLYLNPKSATDDVPFAETLSVVLLELEPPEPPRSKTSPEGSPQQRWLDRFSTSVTFSWVKVPSPSNLTQDRELKYCQMKLAWISYSYIYFSFLGSPPHTNLLQMLELLLAFGRSPTGQFDSVLGLKTSAELRSEPPMIKAAETQMFMHLAILCYLGKGSKIHAR